MKRWFRALGLLGLLLLLSGSLVLLLTGTDSTHDPASVTGNTPRPFSPTTPLLEEGDKNERITTSNNTARPGDEAPSATSASELSLPARVTIDGRPATGVVLSLVLPTGERRSVVSEPDGTCTLRLPRDARVRLEVRRPDRAERQPFVAETYEPNELMTLTADELVDWASLEIGAVQSEEAPLRIKVANHARGLTLRVALLERAVLTGRVVDTGGAAVSGARVWSGRLETRSDPAGRFQLVATPAHVIEEWGVMAEAPGAGMGFAHLEDEDADARLAFEPVTLTLKAGVSFKGRVQDQQGRPLRAQVVVRGAFPHEFSPTCTWFLQCDAEGWFSIATIPPGFRGWTQLQVEAGLVGYERRQQEVLQPPGASPPVIRLRRLQPTTGVVVGAEGRPVPEAELLYLDDASRVRSELGRDPREPEDPTRPRPRLTNARGEFSLDLPTGGGWLLVRAPDGHGPALLEVSPPCAGLRIALPKGLQLSGTIRTRSGVPFSNMILLLIPKGAGVDGDVRREGTTRRILTKELPCAIDAVRTDSEGGFVFQGVPPGSFDLYAWLYKHLKRPPVLAAEGLTAGSRNLSILFDPPPYASVIVRPQSAETGQSLRRTTVRLFDEHGKLLEESHQRRALDRVWVSTWVFGTLTLEVRQDHHLPYVQQLRFAPHQRMQLRPALTWGGGTLVVRVRPNPRHLLYRLRARDPVTGFEAVGHTTTEDDQYRCTLHLSPGEVTARLECLGAGGVVLREVPVEATLQDDSNTVVRLDLSR